MNVKTDLKAGGFIQDAWTSAGRAIGRVEQAVATANNQAADLTRNVLATSSKVADCLAYTFKWR